MIKKIFDELSEKAKEESKALAGDGFEEYSREFVAKDLNNLELVTHVSIYRHLKTSETVICLEGCLDEVFFEELPTVDTGGSVHDGETATDETQFVEVARFRICPREGKYGIQIPKGAWHTVEVYEPSTIFEAKDGKYGG